MSYQLVDKWQQKAISVTQSCRALGLSRSGYYAARKRERAPVVLCHQAAALNAAFKAHGQSYGSRRLRTSLQDYGITIGRHRVRRLMREQGLRPVWKRKFTQTTDSKHDLPVSANILNRQFNPIAPNVAWVSDITYIRTRSGWLYLAAVLDLYSRKIIGWAMGAEMTAQLVCTALQVAIAQRNPAAGLVVHSDRGSQYASASYQSLLSAHHIVGSMSRKANCWDSAVMERFFLNLKMERVWQRDYANHAEARKDVADYIVGFYNCISVHSKLGNLPPNAFE